ncbi:MAG: 2Fe-2S iron-sulfur cluster binding domain-containing protein [Salinicola sp.]|uniref:(2Fe-2S)-binding protein n=1 Tax=Salinicola sp. TaxID=1978524 RepID=UPI001D700B78|nr:2Fe-2S iron-sulfur cluster-binding protein [Salinicola sp.]NRB56168.1 2Fe-2S iron-sulfur cluster binding domain-containing protein [Salinicola sp.]
MDDNQRSSTGVGIYEPGNDSTQPRSPGRRRFLQTAGVSGLVVAAAPALSQVSYAGSPDQPATQTDAPPAKGKQRITLTVNGQRQQLDVTPNVILLDALRHGLGLTGTKKGCDHGQCGACTILVNGTSINSCLSLAVTHDGDEITTVEGLEKNGQQHPIQQAFLEHDAYQCGYCTAGQMMSAVAILQDESIGTSDADVREAMSGNICRCGAYKNIVAAIQSVRGNVQGGNA